MIKINHLKVISKALSKIVVNSILIFYTSPIRRMVERAYSVTPVCLSVST